MFEWKNFETSRQDYQNYVVNEDDITFNRQPMDIIEWQKLYNQVKQRSLNNKKIKNAVLKYEASIKNVMHADHKFLFSKKEALKKYHEHINEMRINCNEVFEQLSFLHLNCLSSCIQFMISRMLLLQQGMIQQICEKNELAMSLKIQLQNTQLADKLFATPNYKVDLQKQKLIILQESQQAIDKQIHNQKMKMIEDNAAIFSKESERKDYKEEMERFYLINSIEDVLKNREKILKTTGTPLELMLSEYLKEVLVILDNQREVIIQTQTTKEFDFVNKSYANSSYMKTLINYDQLKSNIEGSLKRPVRQFVRKVQDRLRNQPTEKNYETIEQETQTTSLKQSELVRALEKNNIKLIQQLDNLKISKGKMEAESFKQLENTHKIELKNIELASKNKSLESMNKRLTEQVKLLNQKIIKHQQNSKQNQTRILLRNVDQRSIFQKTIKDLENTVKKLKGEKIDQMKSTQTQTKQTLNLKTAIKENLRGSFESFNSSKSIKRGNNLQYTKRKQKISIRVNDKQIQKQAFFNKQSKFRQNIGLNQTDRENNQNEQLRPNYMRSATNKLSKMMPFNINSQNNSNYYIPNKNQEGKGDCYLKIPSDGHRDHQTHSYFQIKEGFQPSGERSKIKKLTEFNKKHMYHRSYDQSNFQVKNSTNRLETVEENQNPIHKNSRKLSNTNEINKRNQSIKNTLKILQIPIAHLNQESQNKEGDQQELNKMPIERKQSKQLVNFVNEKFEMLRSINFFDLFKNLCFSEKEQTLKKQQKSKQEQNMILENPISIKLSGSITETDINLFFSLSQAEKYQKNAGLWRQIDDFIMVDNNYAHMADQIEKHFNKLKVQNELYYNQCILFLERPHFFHINIRNKQIFLQKVGVFRQSLNKNETSKHFIKNLFRKLLRLHVLVHNKCNHVHEFLKKIGLTINQ